MNTISRGVGLAEHPTCKTTKAAWWTDLTLKLKLRKSNLDEKAAHDETKAQLAKLGEEEHAKAIADYRESQELKEEVNKLFSAGYDLCLGRLRDLHLDFDLSGLSLGNEDEEVVEAVEVALTTSLEESLEAAPKAIIAEQRTVPTIEECVASMSGVVFASELELTL
ncbi:hypothetical protein Taro_009960 [Colocasia esculenta]|uniref:Uncharacterized protein n=1 Tax=Colocasia esculenta TaxID=4460 RepID=A0A843U2C2_COLES|nr:hypothetical protein [Colocasia esculenta]